VRGAVIEALEGADLDGDEPLLRDGFVYEMIIQHEAQHTETMLRTLQLMEGEGYRPEAPVEPPAGGPFVMGTDDRARALDNERDAHEVHVPSFLMDRTPVTNTAFLEFVESGGYEKRELWDPAGWECIKQERISAPKHWYQPEPHSWWTARFGFDEPLDPALPVAHVSWSEADAWFPVH
jgi:gamma-glutamyl hercynylcysteine S-oxide synthase